MSTYVIKLGDDELTIGNEWSEQDAIETFYDKTKRELQSGDGFVVDSIRPATVRETLAEHYGDDWARRIDHVAKVVYRTGGKDQLVFNGTKANDVHGYDDYVDVSNYRVLQDRWSECEGLSRGPWSNCDVVALELDMPAPDDVIEVLEGLDNYPVIDDEECSRVEQEFIQEHWESYGRHDVIAAVTKALGVDDLTETAKGYIDTLVWDGILDYGCGGGYPSMIDVSACDFGDEAVAEFFVENRGRVVTINNGHGQCVTFDMRRSNIVA